MQTAANPLETATRGRLTFKVLNALEEKYCTIYGLFCLIVTLESLGIRNIRNNLDVRLHPLQVGVCVKIFVVVVQQDGSVVHRRESQGRNAHIADEAAIGAAREHLQLDGEAPGKKKNWHLDPSETHSISQVIRCPLESHPKGIGVVRGRGRHAWCALERSELDFDVSTRLFRPPEKL